MAQPWPTDCPLWLSEPCLLLTLAGTCCKAFDNPSVLWASHVHSWKTDNSSCTSCKEGCLGLYLPLQFLFQICLKSCAQKEGPLQCRQPREHSTSPCHLGTEKTSWWLALVYALYKDQCQTTQPHRTEAIPNEVLTSLPSSWIWGQLRRDKLPWGNSDPGNHCLDSPWKNLHIPSSLVWSVLLSTTLCFCLIYLLRKTKWEK